MPALRIHGTTTMVHPNEDGFWLDSPFAPLPVEWSPEYLRDQIRAGLIIEVTD